MENHIFFLDTSKKNLNPKCKVINCIHVKMEKMKNTKFHRMKTPPVDNQTTEIAQK